MMNSDVTLSCLVSQAVKSVSPFKRKDVQIICDIKPESVVNRPCLLMNNLRNRRTRGDSLLRIILSDCYGTGVQNWTN